MKHFLRTLAVALAVMMAGNGCTNVDDDRAFGSCRIDLTNISNWTIYGVNGLGTYRYFVKDRRLPSNFPYTATTYTGLGGVLLIDVGVGATQPVAYEMSCPYERKKSVVVQMDDATLEAVCPECKSRFNVLMANGMGVEGPAAKQHMGMHRYKVTATASGGYLITN